MSFIKENWFKLSFIIITAYAVLFFISAYQNQTDRQLWAQERLKAYEMCLTAVFPDGNTNIANAGFTSHYDAYKAAFRACKNISENF